MAADADFEALGLLVGLEGQARQERVDLINWLLDRGFELDHIRGSVGAPLNLASSRVIGDDGTCVSAREICRSAGVDLAFLQRIHRAIGLPRIDDPDAANLLLADGEAAVQARIILDLGIDPDEVIAVLRVMSESLGHTAAVMREAALKAILRPGATEIEVAEAIEALALRAAPSFGPMMEALLRLELRRSFAIEAVTAAERAAGILPGARPVTVCFADLTGFTMLGEQLPPEDLERVANRLAELAHDVSSVPVRFVKSIGDAVMLISFEPVPLVDVVLDLADAAAANDLPPLRIGIASGCAVSRAGDWFGSPVNVASRVTTVAGPGVVLATASTRDAVGTAGDFTWSSIGPRQLRGVSGDITLFRVGRPVSQLT
ncbi:adenylate/guanylate cyclase domain-containing protein [Mycolicibacterium stellerae]|uniref:adenylate/guanylate cyclase domain-containing protein n=1 Tax=Mycolicibacterium stellerae TaxID=2358193 RepID=UPI000F0BC77F|nr:adenylate/guanylate cyclase domain-containing protein [Mycolicibacterium stellerae]